MRKAIIVAMANNRTIGKENRLPWHLSEDLKYFKQTTLGKPILMGRKTYESIGKPLPGRLNIVLTRDVKWQAEGVVVATSLEEAFSLAEAQAKTDAQREFMVIGGDQLYASCLPMMDRLYITKVHANVEGDAWFPEVNWNQWKEVSKVDFKAEGANPYDYSFVVYDRLG